MMALEDIRLKADVMERLGAQPDDAIAAACRDMAFQWRLLEIQAAFLDTRMDTAHAEAKPPTRC